MMFHDFSQYASDQKMILALGAVVFVTFVLGLISWCWARLGRRTVLQDRRVRWFVKPKNRPAVYVLQSLADPRVFKVGYTARRVEDRVREIEAQRGKVRIVCFTRMPYAYAAEMRAHAHLSRKWGVKNLGNEWYRIGSEARLRRIVSKCCRSVRFEAKLKFAWPEDGNISVYEGDRRK